MEERHTHPCGAWRGVWNRGDGCAKALLAGEKLMQFIKHRESECGEQGLSVTVKGINLSLDAGRVCGKKYTCQVLELHIPRR